MDAVEDVAYVVEECTCPLRRMEPPIFLHTIGINLDKLKRKSDDAYLLTYDSVFTDVLMRFRLCSCPHDFNQTLKFGWEAATHGGTLIPRPLTKLYLATEAAECLARLKVMVTEKWEAPVQTVIRYFEDIGVENMYADTFHSTHLKSWVMSVFSHANWCPNYHIRIQLLNVIQMWVQHDHLGSLNIGRWIVHGLMQLSEHLSAKEHLVTHSKNARLDSSWFKVMQSLLSHGYVNKEYEEAAVQIRSLKVGPEARWLASVAELLADRSEVAMVNILHCSCFDSYRVLKIMKRSFYLLNHLVLSSEGVKAYSCLGLDRVAVASLIKTTSCTLAVIPTLIGERSERTLLNSTVRLLEEVWERFVTCKGSRHLVTVLERDFIKDADSIWRRASRIGIKMPFHLTCKDARTPDCPENFADALTYSVMDSPVLLKKSQVTVDERTLVYLLLKESPLCPFTRTPLQNDSFCRLPHLQQKIRAWRKKHSCESKKEDLKCDDNGGTKFPSPPHLNPEEKEGESS